MTLVIMAAGMGSRFGGLKQVEPVGPNGEFIVDYAIYDVIRLGFEKVVFIIKKENYELFKETVGSRIEHHIRVEYVFQELANIPSSYDIPAERIKPWGTAHAIWCCKDVVEGDFIVMNSDDFYGYDGFKVVSDYLKQPQTDQSKEHYCMAGYRVKNTITEHGSVNRGVSEIDLNGFLISLTESKIEQHNNQYEAIDSNGNHSIIDGNRLVSMNLFGFRDSLFSFLEAGLHQFLEINKDNLEKVEYYIPSVIDQLIKEEKINFKVLDTKAIWKGVTYQEDKEELVGYIHSLIGQGEYPQSLWN